MNCGKCGWGLKLMLTRCYCMSAGVVCCMISQWNVSSKNNIIIVQFKHLQNKEILKGVPDSNFSFFKNVGYRKSASDSLMTIPSSQPI